MFATDYPKEYFSPKATLECGQIFRYEKTEKGTYRVFSADKACLLATEKDSTKLICEEKDKTYFHAFFDLDRDYAPIVAEAKAFNIPYLSQAAEYGKGLRILNQNKAECIISFIISQQNNIPRIKGILARLCNSLGEKKRDNFGEYYTFPTLTALAEQTETFYREIGLGYRAKYVVSTAAHLFEEGFSALEAKSGKELKNALVKYMGIGNKVADCISLFAFHDASAFPVDTWIEKLYHENFGGTEHDREKINKFFTEKFGRYAGIFQQYLFYYKRERG